MTAFRSTPKLARKLPRPGTRVAAVIKAWQANPTASHWSDLKRAYDCHTPALSYHSRRYTGMELSRITKRYGRRVSRGVYRLDERWWNPIAMPIGQTAKSSGLGYEVGDLVVVVKPNADLENLGCSVGAVVKVTWIETERECSQKGFAGCPTARLVQIDNSMGGLFFAWRFQKASPLPKYPEYLDELEDLAISTRDAISGGITISEIAQAIDDTVTGIDQILAVIRQAKDGKW